MNTSKRLNTPRPQPTTSDKVINKFCNIDQCDFDNTGQCIKCGQHRPPIMR